MTGLERNAEVVQLCSYAPLFAHVDGWQWTPDLIWFDNLNSFGTVNYYVQKMFSNNKGTDVLPIVMGNKPLTGQDGLYASATFDQNTRQIILKLVNTNGQARSVHVVLDGIKKAMNKGTATTLQSDDLTTFNSMDQPMKLIPVEKEISIKKRTVNQQLAPYSFSVIKIKQEL